MSIVIDTAYNNIIVEVANEISVFSLNSVPSPTASYDLIAAEQGLIVLQPLNGTVITDLDNGSF